MSYGASCCEKGIDYLDGYGVNTSSDYGSGLIIAIIGATASVIGTTGGLVQAGMGKKMQREALEAQRIAQEELIEAQRIAQEKALRQERVKTVQRQQFVVIGVSVLLIGFIAVLRVRRNQ